MIEYVNFGKTYLVIGYDWEMSEDVDIELESLEIISKAHLEYNIPFTLFILGELLEYNKICNHLTTLLKNKKFNRIIDIGQHSYSHTEFKKIKDDGEPLTIREIKKEVRKTNKLIYEKFAIECHGMRAPQGYYRGFQDNDDILEALYDEDILYISSDLRNREGLFPSEWKDKDSNYRQPYFYDKKKYPKLLEIPTHGWNDNALKGMSKTTKIKKHSLEEELNVYKNYLNYAIKNRLVYAPLFHPWAIAMSDKKGFTIRNLFRYAKEKNVKVLNYKQIYGIAINKESK